MCDNKPKYTILEAKAKLEAYCAYQERCAHEISQKLWLWKLDLEDHDILIADLISNNFLNEERFAEAFASGKFNIKKWGRTKIKTHLKAKQISTYSINKALKSIDLQDYTSAINGLAEKKWPQITGNHWEKLGKLQRYLHSKGYESDLLSETLQKYIDHK